MQCKFICFFAEAKYPPGVSQRYEPAAASPAARFQKNVTKGFYGAKLTVLFFSYICINWKIMNLNAEVVGQQGRRSEKPGWLKIRLHRTTQFAEVDRIVREHALHTICSSGMCPNKAECWSRRTATFMILGDVCTRSCRFCATRTGRPLPPDDAEPGQLARSVKLMGFGTLS